MELESMKNINSFEVLNKYLDNSLPTRRELLHWLVDLPFLIELNNEKGEESEDFACFYLNMAIPFINKALKKKYGFKEAIHFINYNIFNNDEVKNLKIEMANIIKLEDKNFYEIVIYLKKVNKFH